MSKNPGFEEEELFSDESAEAEFASDTQEDAEDKPTILIVDDESDILQVLSLFLNEYNVITSESVQQAMEILVFKEIDLLITDVNMPGASGFELASLTELMEGGLPVVVISGHEPEDTMRARFPSTICVDFLEKPFSREKIVEAVEMALCCEIKSVV